MATAVPASAAGKKPAPPLSAAGQKLEADFAGISDQLKAEIRKALPAVDKAKQAASAEARQAEAAAATDLAAAQKRMGEIGAAQGLVAHAKGKWIGGANKGIAEAKAKLQKATTDADRKAAEAELAKWQKNLADGEAALKERQAQLDKALADKAKNEHSLQQAEQARAAATARMAKASDELGLKPLLVDGALDAKLAKVAVLTEATPRGLAAFAEQGPEQEKLVARLLADDRLLVEMATADGAKNGRYGEALQIYESIQKASDKAREGTLQRLALAIALEHAQPVGQRNAVSKKDAPATVDPVGRYRHYEKAFADGELDASFKNLTVWDIRMVVDGEEPDDMLAWGREMLRNYRPDHLTTPDSRWRYVGVVRTDVKYGSQDCRYDQDELQFFQNILMNGGVCGRRAFFGRFILRAFGVPTTARPQPGHAALAHWTPSGWVVCLGAGWGHGTTKTLYTKDLDFLAATQARAVGPDFMPVKRAQWIGDVFGETRQEAAGGEPAECVTPDTALFSQQRSPVASAPGFLMQGGSRRRATRRARKPPAGAGRMRHARRCAILAATQSSRFRSWLPDARAERSLPGRSWADYDWSHGAIARCPICDRSRARPGRPRRAGRSGGRGDAPAKHLMAHRGRHEPVDRGLR